MVSLISSFVGYLFFPGPLGDLKRVSGDVFGSTDSIGGFQENIFFVLKIDFLPRGKPTVLGQK